MEILHEEFGIPINLHAPHFMHGVNLANHEKFEYNRNIFDQVEWVRNKLFSRYTVVHAGMNGSIDEVIKQLKIICPQNMLLENKPYRAPMGNRNLCRGYNVEEVKSIVQEIGCGFCLDIGHAICSANSLQISPYKMIEDFNELAPQMYHISDGDINSDIDRHLHFGMGSFDFKRIFKLINPNACFSIETEKNSKYDLCDFEKDVEYLSD